MEMTYTFTETTPSAASTVASSAAVVGSIAGAPLGVAVGGLDGLTGLFVEAILQGATGGTLDVYLQVCPIPGGNWYDYAHWVQIAAAAAPARFVFAVANTAQQLTITATGTNLTPALAAGTVVGGPWGDRLRLVFVAGAGTSAGAVQTIIVTGQRAT